MLWDEPLVRSVSYRTLQFSCGGQKNDRKFTKTEGIQPIARSGEYVDQTLKNSDIDVHPICGSAFMLVSGPNWWRQYPGHGNGGWVRWLTRETIVFATLVTGF